MARDTFVRDQTVKVTINFLDAAGAATNPASANVTFEYSTGDGTRTSNTYALTQNGNDWTYEWDSSVAEAGIVYGHAVGAGTPTVAVDFEFKLTANAANEAV